MSAAPPFAPLPSLWSACRRRVQFASSGPNAHLLAAMIAPPQVPVDVGVMGLVGVAVGILQGECRDEDAGEDAGEDAAQCWDCGWWSRALPGTLRSSDAIVVTALGGTGVRA